MWNSLCIYCSVEKKLILEVAGIITIVKSKPNYLFIAKVILSFFIFNYPSLPTWDYYSSLY